MWLWILLIAGLGSLVALSKSIDTPIIVSDGSLYVHSETPWAQFVLEGGAKVHPERGKSITRVEIQMPGNSKIVDCKRQQCKVFLRYGGTALEFSTGADGKTLRFITDHAAFHPGENEKRIRHNDEHSKISLVEVTRGSHVMFTGTASGGTSVTIHYE